MKVSVIITAHNYGRFLSQCIESILAQNFEEYETIVVDDGSTDDTAEVIKRYIGKLKVLTLKGEGLATACNKGIRASNGRYIVRLDADDYFDPNLLLVESNILDKNPGIHMVYPDYYTVNRMGEILECVRLPKVNDEIKLLDRSCLQGGAMFRRECFDAIGGYDETLRYQEDYDFWLKFIDKFKVHNVNLPLLYYRKHTQSMSTNRVVRMEARRYVKKRFVEAKGGCEDRGILGLVLARADLVGGEKAPIKMLNGKPAVAYTIEEANRTKLLERVILSTEDMEVAEISSRFKAEVPFLRPRELSKATVSAEEVVLHCLRELESKEGYRPKVVVILPYICPLRQEKHITEAIDTMFIYKTHSVLSVVEDKSFHWKVGEYGLAPVGYKKRLLREDKETVYRENAAIYVTGAENIYKGNLLGDVVGHIEMFPEESVRLNTEFDFWLAERILERNK